MPCVAHLMLVMLHLAPFVAYLMLVMILNLPEQCSFQDLLFHLLFLRKSAEKPASRMDISLLLTCGLKRYHYEWVPTWDIPQLSTDPNILTIEYVFKKKSEENFPSSS